MTRRRLFLVLAAFAIAAATILLRQFHSSAPLSLPADLPPAFFIQHDLVQGDRLRMTRIANEHGEWVIRECWFRRQNGQLGEKDGHEKRGTVTRQQMQEIYSMVKRVDWEAARRQPNAVPGADAPQLLLVGPDFSRCGGEKITIAAGDHFPADIERLVVQVDALASACARP